jgi:hypothetical protein
LEEGQTTLFTCLDMLGQEQTEELVQKKERYKKISRAKQTLVFEVVDVFIKILDTATDTFFL